MGCFGNLSSIPSYLRGDNNSFWIDFPQGSASWTCWCSFGQDYMYTSYDSENSTTARALRPVIVINKADL